MYVQAECHCLRRVCLPLSHDGTGAAPKWGQAKSLDIIARDGAVYLAIECKKAREQSLTFLRPEGLQHTGVSPSAHYQG